MHSYLKDRNVGPNTEKQPEDQHSSSGGTGCFQVRPLPLLLERECGPQDGGHLLKRNRPLGRLMPQIPAAVALFVEA